MLGGAKNIVFSIRQCFLDIIFPKYCLLCGREGTYWCPQCQVKDILSWSRACFGCHKSSSPLSLCSTCQPLYHFDGLLCAADYEDETISALIQAYKYRFVKELAPELGLIMAKHLAKELAVSKHEFFKDFFRSEVMAVPLSQRRHNWRGFNQAEEVAKFVADYFNLSYSSQLKRLKHRPPQAKLSEAERLNNLAGCFGFSGEAPTKIILIDDVITTGATVNECAKVLRAAGAEEILVLACAKG
jgi:competence protein ComFC